MVDNIDPTTQNAPKEGDMTYVKLESGKTYGCSTGQHDFIISDSDVQKGEEEGCAAIIMKCALCGITASVESNLGINDLIDKYDADVRNAQMPGVQQSSVPARVYAPQPEQQPQFTQPPQQEIDNDEILKKLFGK